MQPAQITDHLTLLDRKRFTGLWRELCVEFNAEHCNQVFDELSEFYREADRHYHTDSHIHHCLGQLDNAVDSGKSFPHLEMAIWFHDVIYTPGDPDNEKKSAVWFKQRASSHFSQKDIDAISNLITITEHRDEPVSEDEKLMVDIDLSSFGLPRPQFEKDGERVRKEFPEMSDRDFFEGQIVFLENLMERPALYSTTYFQNHFEKAARQNINRLLTQYKTALMH